MHHWMRFWSRVKWSGSTWGIGPHELWGLCGWHFSIWGSEMWTDQYSLFLQVICSLPVHGSGTPGHLPLVTATRGSMFWWNSSHTAGVKRHICWQHFLHALPKLFQGLRRAVQHFLHSKRDDNNQFTIIVRSRCAVQSCGISMYHYDLWPRPLRSPLWAPPPIVHAYSRWAKKLPCSCFCFFCFKRSLWTVFLVVYFSLPKTFLKEKSLTVVIWLHFLSELILSRVEKNSVVLPCFVKWQSGRNTWCTHIFWGEKKTEMKEMLADLRDFVVAGGILQ